MPWTELPVTGMSCRACEVRVGKKLREVPGVEQVRVSARQGVARVRTGQPAPSRAALVQAVEGVGYQVRPEARPWLSGDRGVWRDVVLGVAAVAVLALLARLVGLTELGNRLTDGAGSGGLLVVLLVGLTAGVSTCMALVGGLVLAVSARYAESHPHSSTRARLRPQLAFHAGRLGGFVLLGGLVGLLGSAATLSGAGLGVAMAVVGLVMALLGLRLTAVSPRLSAAGLPTLPGGLARVVGASSERGGGYSDLRSGVLGALSFFLPCGFTQAMQLYALSTGSAAQGAAVMGLFALGTAPGLLGLGGAAAAARGAGGQRFIRFAGVVVLAFALVNLSGAARLLGVEVSLGGTAAAATTLSPNVTVSGGVQTVRLTQDGDGYSPHDTTIYAGLPVRWVITSKQSFSCAASLYAPSVGVRGVLEMGENVFQFIPRKTGTLPFSCAMGMYTGAFHVIAAPAAAPSGSGSGSPAPAGGSAQQG